MRNTLDRSTKGRYSEMLSRHTDELYRSGKWRPSLIARIDKESKGCAIMSENENREVSK
jgi:hypothetical protein